MSPPLLRAAASAGAAILAEAAGDSDAAVALARSAGQLAAEAGAQTLQALALAVEGDVSMWGDSRTQALERLHEAIDLASSAPDGPARWGWASRPVVITSATLSLAETYRFRDPKRARELLRPALEVSQRPAPHVLPPACTRFPRHRLRELSGCRKPVPEIARRRARTRVRAKSIAQPRRPGHPGLGPGRPGHGSRRGRTCAADQPRRRPCVQLGAVRGPAGRRPDRTGRHHLGWPRSRHRHLSDRRPRPRLRPASIVSKASPRGTAQWAHLGRGRGSGTREAGSASRPTCPRTGGLPHRGRSRVARRSRSCPRRSSYQ